MARILDYGCGTGHTAPILLDRFNAQEVTGIDVSAESIAVARERYALPRVQFASAREPRVDVPYDLVYCSGIFHHIPPPDRLAALAEIHRALRPGAYFAFWENNPWNPGTRYMMSRIPFDRDAVTLSASAARRMLAAAGFHVLRTDFLFIFPRALSCFRSVEGLVSRLPIGAQSQVLCIR